MKQYTHVFFDLDHTLWDFERNSEETLLQLFEEYNLKEFGLFDEPAFICTYREINKYLWNEYNSRKIDKNTLRTQRFERTFSQLGLQQADIPMDFDEKYISICPTKSWLFPHAIEVLEALTQKYQLGIITNGFSESQYLKMKSSNILHYFRTVVIAEDAGFHKPDSKIFEYALKELSGNASASIMIGDNLDVDIQGACNAGIDQVYFNPEKDKHDRVVTHEIESLIKLMEIL